MLFCGGGGVCTGPSGSACRPPIIITMSSKCPSCLILCPNISSNIIQLSINRIVPYPDALDRYHRVLRVGPLALSVVVDCISPTVGIIPGIICNQSVPQLIGGRSHSCQSANEAGREVGLEEAWVEVDVDEVKARIVMLKVEALEVTIVPGVVGIRGSRFDPSLQGSVPVLMTLDKVAVRERDD